jgi:hypothetical protein
MIKHLGDDDIEEEDKENVEEGVENTQWISMHNQLGETQGRNVLNNNTKFEFKFEDIEEVTDEDNTEDVTGCDWDEEDEKREAMWTYIDSKSSKCNKKVTGDTCDNVNAGGDEDDDGENCEDRYTEWVAGDEIKNIREEEAELEDASENTFDDEDIGEDEIKNTSEEEPKFEDASEDALDDEDIGED